MLGIERTRRAAKGKLVKTQVQVIFNCINEVTAAIIAAASHSVEETTEWGYLVQTTPRLAQWKVEALCSYRESEPFKIGLWNWQIVVERGKQLYVKLCPEASSLKTQQPPIVSFIIKLTFLAPGRKTITHPEIFDKQLTSNEGFVWAVDTLVTGRFIVDVEFTDIKITPKSGGEPLSIWNTTHPTPHSPPTPLLSLSRMLAEGIHTDITITTTTTSPTIAAHRAVLSARSPVFRGMFSHNLLEKELSSVTISDMSFEACKALLNYMYGNFKDEEFLAHRIELLGAADKYDMVDLKEACSESLLDDIDSRNVIVRLEAAHLYRLPELKASCLRYLVRLGKVFEVRDEFGSFLMRGDRELVAEVVNEVLCVWKGF